MAPPELDVPLSTRLRALSALRAEIAMHVPRASARDRVAWLRLQPDLGRMEILAKEAEKDAARAALEELLDVLLRFRVSLQAGPTRAN